MGREPCCCQLSRDPQNKNLATGYNRLPDEGDVEVVLVGRGHLNKKIMQIKEMGSLAGVHPGVLKK